MVPETDFDLQIEQCIAERAMRDDHPELYEKSYCDHSDHQNPQAEFEYRKSFAQSAVESFEVLADENNDLENIQSILGHLEESARDDRIEARESNDVGQHYGIYKIGHEVDAARTRGHAHGLIDARRILDYEFSVSVASRQPGVELTDAEFDTEATAELSRIRDRLASFGEYLEAVRIWSLGDCSVCEILDWFDVPVPLEIDPESEPDFDFEPDPNSERHTKKPANNESPQAQPMNTLTILPAGELIRKNPAMRPLVVCGLLREGETMNVIAAPKMGKSWLVLGLALSVVAGRKWLNQHWTKQGKVLIVDNELHSETIASRIPYVADQMGIPLNEYADALHIANVRGSLTNLNVLAIQLMKLNPGDYKLIVLDAFYRFLPKGVDENSNADVTGLYNLLDVVASKIGCAFVCVHHTSKGNQGSKAVTDTGSGAGAQARAADTHLVIRQHKEDGAVVVDAAIRSFSPMMPFSLRREGSIFRLDESLDPSELRVDRPIRGSKQTGDSRPSKDEQQKQRDDENLERILAAYRTFPNGETESILSETAGVNFKYFRPINSQLLRDGQVVHCDVQKSRKKPYPGLKLVDPKCTPTLRHSDKNTLLSESSECDKTHTPTTAPPLGGSRCRSVVESPQENEPRPVDYDEVDARFGTAEGGTK